MRMRAYAYDVHVSSISTITTLKPLFYEYITLLIDLHVTRTSTFEYHRRCEHNTGTNRSPRVYLVSVIDDIVK